jgi:hypothetical protein
MKKLLLPAFLLISILSVSAQTLIPIDTSGRRYYDTVFTNVTVITNINYGSNVNINNSTQQLALDIYMPTGDTVSQRPVIVLAHGGSFISGIKTSPDVVNLCVQFAKRGYVCVSIQYRLGIGFPVDSIRATKAVVRAVQDMKAAIRFLRKDFFTNGNQYKIHPNYIFAGGVSAGGFTALHLAYMDKISEVPTWVNISAMGGIDGNSGNPSYTSLVNGVVNLCGALGDSTWLEPGDKPFVSMHGDQDQTVPYGTATISVLSTPIMVVDGSASLKLRADNIGVQNNFYRFAGADHVPFATGNQTAQYMDTTVWFVRDFLRPLLTVPSNTGFADEKSTVEFNLYPNPNSGQFIIQLSENDFEKYNCEITDVTGKQVMAFQLNSQQQLVNAEISKGIYILRLYNNKGLTVKKFVVE